jgi:hypothetical protein
MNNLTKGLKSSDFNIRKNAMCSLAYLGTEDALKQLIRVVSKKRINLFRKYSLADKLVAINYLGKSGSKISYDFLVKLYTPKVRIEDGSFAGSTGSGGVGESWYDYPKSVIFEFPNAYGGLREYLQFEISLGDRYYGGYGYNDYN